MIGDDFSIFFQECGQSADYIQVLENSRNNSYKELQPVKVSIIVQNSQALAKSFELDYIPTNSVLIYSQSEFNLNDILKVGNKYYTIKQVEEVEPNLQSIYKYWGELNTTRKVLDL